MTPREVDTVRARLADTADTAAALARHAEDLYRLAYEKNSSPADVKVSGDTGGSENGTPAGVHSVGDLRARHLWRKLERQAKASELALRAILHGTGNLFAEGEIDDRIRFGSALTPAEFDRLRARQAQRIADGDPTPVRIEEQPDHPGRTGRKKSRRR